MARIRRFLEGTEAGDRAIETQQARSPWIEPPLARFQYWRPGKTDRGLVPGFIQKASGYSRIQVKRRQRRCPPIHIGQIAGLWARTDELHGTLCERAFTVFGQSE